MNDFICEIYKNRVGRWHWRFRAKDSKKVKARSGRGYSSHVQCKASYNDFYNEIKHAKHIKIQTVGGVSAQLQASYDKEWLCQRVAHDIGKGLEAAGVDIEYPDDPG